MQVGHEFNAGVADVRDVVDRLVERVLFERVGGEGQASLSRYGHEGDCRERSRALEQMGTWVGKGPAEMSRTKMGWLLMCWLLLGVAASAGAGGCDKNKQAEEKRQKEIAQRQKGEAAA